MWHLVAALRYSMIHDKAKVIVTSSVSIINNSLNIIINFIWVACLNLESVWYIDVLSWRTSHSPKTMFHFLLFQYLLEWKHQKEYDSMSVRHVLIFWEMHHDTRREWLHCYLNRHKNHLYMRYLPDRAAICFNLQY